MKVRAIMSPNPACCTPDDTAERAAKLMKSLNVGVIPVIDHEERRKLVGIVTDRDLCCGVVASGTDPQAARLRDYMTRDPACCGPEDDVERVSELMQKRQVRRVPVVDDTGACCGIVAMADLAMKAPREGRVGPTIQKVSQPVPASPSEAA